MMRFFLGILSPGWVPVGEGKRRQDSPYPDSDCAGSFRRRCLPLLLFLHEYERRCAPTATKKIAAVVEQRAYLH